jgi:hypothetical protein
LIEISKGIFATGLELVFLQAEKEMPNKQKNITIFIYLILSKGKYAHW